MLENPRPEDIAAHWSRILEQSLGTDLTIATEMIDIRFVKGVSDRETLRTVHLTIADEGAIRAGAQERGYAIIDNAVSLYGVNFKFG